MLMNKRETNCDLVEAARALGPQIRACADEIERGRRLPQPLVDALAAAGLFKLTLPRELGGEEVTAETYVRVIEEVARADSSASWCVMIAGAVAALAGTLPLSAAREIWESDPLAFAAGSGAGPGGTAIAVDGGYRARGHWSFVSGCQHATWLIGTCRVFDGDSPRLGPNGVPEQRWMFFPTAACRVVDTWHVTGLLGSGSHDIVVEEVFVPHERTVAYSHFEPPWHHGPLYAFATHAAPGSTTFNPGAALISIGFAATALGTARGALDAFAELAGSKTPLGGKALLRDHAVVQAQIGQSEATLRSARAFLYERVRDVWNTVCRAEPTTVEQQVLLRLSGTHAAARAAEVVETAWKAAGASSIFVGSPLERRFRDAHVITQNIAVSPAYYGTGGRHFLGGSPGV